MIKKWFKKKENKWIFFGVFIGAFAISSPFIIMAISKQKFNLSSFQNLGVVGDFFGGSTVGLLSLASMLFVIAAIVMQKDELSMQREELQLTRDELKKTREEHELSNKTLRLQQFESTFFNMINMHNSLLNDMKLGDAKGREVINQHYENINELFSTVYLNKAFKDFLMSNFDNNDFLVNAYYNFRRNLLTLSDISMEDISEDVHAFDEEQIKINISAYIKQHRYGLLKFPVDIDTMVDYKKLFFKTEIAIFFSEKYFDDSNFSYQKLAYYEALKNDKYPLSHYIKSIKTIISLVNDNELSMNAFNQREKEKYLNIFFSQFSIHEITLIEYYIILGEDQELKKYFDDYGILGSKDILDKCIILTSKW